MKCSECRELLHLEADGEELLSRSCLDQHLRACASCRAFQAGLQRLAEVAARNPAPSPSPDFAARLLAAVLADQNTPAPEAPDPGVAHGSRAAWALVLVLAASLLVGIGLSAYRSALVNPTAPGLALDLPKTPAPELPTLRESVRQAGSALTALTTRTADEVAERTRQMLPLVPTPALPSLEPMVPLVEPPTRSLAQAGQVVADGLQPVTDSARRAFDLFLREIPMPSDPGSGL